MTGAGARRGLGCHLPTLPTDKSADFSDPKRRGALPTSGEAYDPSRPWVADAPSTAALAAVLTEQFCGGSALSRLRRARSEFQAALSVLLPRSEQKDLRADYRPSVDAASVGVRGLGALPRRLLDACSLLLASGSKKIGQNSAGRFSDGDRRWRSITHFDRLN